jgi:hypothetical protein
LKPKYKKALHNENRARLGFCWLPEQGSNLRPAD